MPLNRPRFKINLIQDLLFDLFDVEYWVEYTISMFWVGTDSLPKVINHDVVRRILLVKLLYSVTKRIIHNKSVTKEQFQGFFYFTALLCIITAN